MNTSKTYIDLFAGCGGLSLGLHYSGWNGLFAVEKNADAFETLRFNLIEKKNHFQWPSWLAQENHDINDILSNHASNLKMLRGKVDLVVGGPPCQGFSMAGRRNENDSRNELVSSYIEFISLVRPKIIFFENVKGFTLGFKTTGKEGKAYSSYVFEKLKSLNYSAKGRLLDFSEYGIPQKRKRFIIVGIQNEILKRNPNLSNDTFFSELWEKREQFLDSKKLITNPNLQDAISDLLHSNGTIKSEKSNFEVGVYGEIKSRYQNYLRGNGEKDCIVDSHRFVRHTEVVRNRFAVALKECLKCNEYRERFSLKKSSTKLLEATKPTPTITTLPDDYIHYCEPRIMTVREYARIQSFPDAFHFKGKYTTGGKKRTQEVPRYSQIGNAIPPIFGEQAGLVLRDLINEQ